MNAEAIGRAARWQVMEERMKSPREAKPASVGKTISVRQRSQDKTAKLSGDKADVSSAASGPSAST